MALVPTPGATSADSYASLAEAQAYMDSLAFAVEWTAATQAQQEGALRAACRKLDLLTWRGIKATSAQALAWPRYNVTTRDGYWIDSATVPAFLKNAQSELALRELQEDRASDPALGQPTRVKAGPVEVEMGQGARRSPAMLPSLVQQMVAAYLTTSGGGVKLVRA